MTTAQVVETSVTVNDNSPIQDYIHLDDQTQPTFEMTPGFKPFTQFMLLLIFINMYLLFVCRELFVIFVKHLSVIAKSAWQHMPVNVLLEMATALNVNEESGIMVYWILMWLNKIKAKLNSRQCWLAVIQAMLLGVLWKLQSQADGFLQLLFLGQAIKFIFLLLVCTCCDFSDKPSAV